MKSLYDELKKYEQSDFYGFHMPGHKRNGGLTGAALPYGIDITAVSYTHLTLPTIRLV